MAFRHDDLTDHVDRGRLQQTDIVANRAPCEIRLAIPRTDAHDGAQTIRILGQIMDVIVRNVAAEPHAGEHHDDVPVIHARSTAVFANVGIHILFQRAS